jgi:predicted metal-dependent hydrolase
MILQQQDKVKYGTATIPFNVIKTRRIKTSELIVDANTITVRVPLDKNKVEIRRIVLDKARWILKKQKEYKGTTPVVAKPSFKENTTLPYLGIKYSLNIYKNQTRNSIEMVDGKFLARLESIKPSPKIVKELYENWMRKEAQNIFQGKVHKYSKQLGVKVERTVIKNLSNRWGSLTKKGVINLNLNLIKAPEAVIDYIILHELCHLKIKEHSHHYWDLVHRFMPNYQDKIEWLKLNGRSLL